MRLLFLTLCAAAPLALAQSNAEIVYWPAGHLKEYSSTLKTREKSSKSMTASEIISDLGNYRFEILRRDTSGTGELHQNWADVFIVQGGEAIIAYGGKIEEAHDGDFGRSVSPRTQGTRRQTGRPVP